jgi:hypothetical protein
MEGAVMVSKVSKPAAALVPLLVASSVIVAGCAAGSKPVASQHAAAAVSSQNGSAAASADGSSAAPANGPAVPVTNALTCATVVDSTGYQNGPLTTNIAVAFLTDMELTDGVASIPAGTPSSDDTNILNTMATELANYSGSQLSTDAEQFSQDEQGYNPDGPVDTSYAQPLDQDIIALERDCPQGTTLGEQWRNKGSS